jgi:hypothetical protein
VKIPGPLLTLEVPRKPWGAGEPCRAEKITSEQKTNMLWYRVTPRGSGALRRRTLRGASVGAQGAQIVRGQREDLQWRCPQLRPASMSTGFAKAVAQPRTRTSCSFRSRPGARSGPQGSSSKVQSGCTSSREDARAQTWSLAKEDFRRATSCIARDDWQAILLRQETAMTTERRQRRQLAAEQQPAPAADGLMLASTDGACTLDVLRIRA